MNDLYANIDIVHKNNTIPKAIIPVAGITSICANLQDPLTLGLL